MIIQIVRDITDEKAEKSNHNLMNYISSSINVIKRSSESIKMILKSNIFYHSHDISKMKY